MRVPLVSIVVLLVLSVRSMAAENRQNVLFLISDDLNNLLGCYGDALAKTPHIDRLAARGLRFNRAYCTFPLCGPSRNSMLTGLYPNSTGILSNGQVFRQSLPGQVSLPQAFRLEGYFAARVGKLFHYGVPTAIGTNGHDDPASWEVETNPAGVDRLTEQPQIFSLKRGEFGGTLSWYASPHDETQHTDRLNAEDAVWLLERCAEHQDRPFFLAVGYFLPHTPYVAPQHPYFDLYQREEMPVVGGVQEDQADLPPAALASYKPEQDQLTDDLRRECLQAYYASISMMDAQVGRVLAALDRLGLADNTVIVFLSDHGYHTGQHGLWQKMSLFEESARTPLLIVAPGVTNPGTVAETPVSHVDLFPTLAELCGIPVPANLQGQSLVPILKDPNETGRGWAITQVTRNEERRRGPRDGKQHPSNGRYFGYSLRTPKWRYTEWDGGVQGRELYDHAADPGELTNLADHPSHKQDVLELASQLRAAVKTTFPPSGTTPEVQGELWGPNLTAPARGQQRRNRLRSAETRRSTRP